MFSAIDVKMCSFNAAASLILCDVKISTEESNFDTVPWFTNDAS